MKKNKIFKVAIYIIVIAFVWIASLYICILLKQEASFNLEEIAQTPGIYTYDDTILGIPVARTIVEVKDPEIIDIYSENYPMMHVFPFLITCVFLGIVQLVSVVMRRFSKKLEI